MTEEEQIKIAMDQNNNDNMKWDEVCANGVIGDSVGATDEEVAATCITEDDPVATGVIGDGVVMT